MEYLKGKTRWGGNMELEGGLTKGYKGHEARGADAMDWDIQSEQEQHSPFCQDIMLWWYLMWSVVDHI